VRARRRHQVRRKLAARSSLFEYLCEANAVTRNPVKGVKRPAVESYEGKTGARRCADPAIVEAVRPRRRPQSATRSRPAL
jgi:hypothetical protein